MNINGPFKLVIAIVVSEAAGIIGSVFTISAIPTWYAGLVKPSLNPPAWVFAPVWTLLYALMGVALWLVWSFDGNQNQEKVLNKTKAILLFVAQLVLSVTWSPVFFGYRSISNALIIIVLLWATVILTIFIFSKVSKTAAYLLLPYILWISFALYLNYSIWILN